MFCKWFYILSSTFHAVDTLASWYKMLFIFIYHKKKYSELKRLRKKKISGPGYNVLTVSKSWIYILFIKICWSFLYLFQL